MHTLDKLQGVDKGVRASALPPNSCKLVYTLEVGVHEDLGINEGLNWSLI